MAMLHPSFAKRSAVTAPSPREPPVMRTLRLVRVYILCDEKVGGFEMTWRWGVGWSLSSVLAGEMGSCCIGCRGVRR